MKNTKCNCELANKITCPKCSTIKMVILLKNGNNHLKYYQNSRKYVSPTWYSHLSKNNKPMKLIINSMYRRFEKSKYKSVSNKLMFFDNKSKEHLKTITI